MRRFRMSERGGGDVTGKSMEGIGLGILDGLNFGFGIGIWDIHWVLG